MDDAVRDALVELCRTHGTEMLDDPAKLEAFLRDTCPGSKREIHCLVGAVRDGAVSDLRGRDLPPEAAETLLAARLRDDLSMQEEAADWTAQALVAALATEPPPSEDKSASSELPDQEAAAGQAEAEVSSPEVAVTESSPSESAPVDPSPESALLESEADSSQVDGLHDQAAPTGEAAGGPPEAAGQNDLGGDLRPGVSAEVDMGARGTQSVSSTAVVGKSGPSDRRRLWIPLALAAAVITVVIAVIIASRPPDDVATSPAAPPSVVAVVTTPTPEVTYGPPETVYVTPSGSTSLEQACTEVATGGTVRLSAGTYRLSSLSIGNVRLVGEGAKRTKVVFARSASPGLAVETGRTFVNGIGFRLAGKPGKNSGDVAAVTGSARAVFVRCRFQSGGYGPHVYDTARLSLRSCIISTNKYSGIGALNRSRLTVVDTESVKSQDGSGLVASDKARVEVRRGEFSDNKGEGISIYDHVRAEITGAVVSNNWYSGIVFFNSATGKTSGCRITKGSWGPDNYGCFRAAQSARVDCLDCVLSNTSGWGIYYGEKARGSVSGNNCVQTRWGIGVEDSAHASLGSNNSAIGNPQE